MEKPLQSVNVIYTLTWIYALSFSLHIGVIFTHAVIVF